MCKGRRESKGRKESKGRRCGGPNETDLDSLGPALLGAEDEVHPVVEVVAHMLTLQGLTALAHKLIGGALQPTTPHTHNHIRTGLRSSRPGTGVWA